MKKLSLLLIAISLVFMSCEDFLNPQQDLVVDEADLPNDERELLSMSLGLYALQQDLVNQIVLLGELRGDLLTVTENADPDLIDINNFNISETNRYANPANFYKLIAASNKMIRILEEIYPEVLDDESNISNAHRMYGEAVAMRTWAYFYAVRIYNEVPYIPETLTSIDEIVSFVNSTGTYIDSTYVDYSPTGAGNDTLGTDTAFIYTERQFLDQEFMTRRCLKDLDEKVRAVGVDYSIKDDINEDSWKVTVWNDNALLALKVQMYMHISAFDDAMDILIYDEKLLNLQDEDVSDNDATIKYALDAKFSNANWQKVITGHEEYEHLFVLDFEKSETSWQQNDLQYYMSIIPPNIYAIKPTKKSVDLWECVWKGYSIDYDANPALTELATNSAGEPDRGTPADQYRGRGVSFEYMKNGIPLSDEEYDNMLNLRTLGYAEEVEEIMRGVDTVAYKYTLGKGAFDKDANFILYRAAALHLYASEIYANNDALRLWNDADQFIYTGDQMSNGKKLGVAGRVGLKTSGEGKKLDGDYVYEFDPYTNEIIGYMGFNGVNEKRKYFDDILMDERGRELAYEGERFFDYIRIARRRNAAGNNGTEWLAESISETFPAEDRATIKARLMNEANWYLPFVLK